MQIPNQDRFKFDSFSASLTSKLLIEKDAFSNTWHDLSKTWHKPQIWCSSIMMNLKKLENLKSEFKESE